MDGDWEEVSRVALPMLGQNPMPVTSMTFDTTQELLWVGNGLGRVTSIYGTELQRYTCFMAGHGAVHQILSHDKGVLALCDKSIHMASRKGTVLWHITHEDMKDLRCMAFTSKGGSQLLAAGMQNHMFVIDVAKGTIVKQIPTSDHYMILKRSRYICAATKQGTVHILDTNTFEVMKTWNAHSSLINDMDAQHDFIVTCGFSLRLQQTYMLDPLVNVFDLKTMTSLPPIPFPAGAAFVRMHPRMVTTSIVISQHGQMHVVDLMNVNTSNVRQANVLSYLSKLEIAPSGEAIALADGDCNIHVWGSPSRIKYAEISNPVEFADHVEDLVHLDWSIDTPLSTVGMPYYREQLLSAWPSHLISDVGAPPVKLDPQFLASLKGTEWGGYGRNTRGVRRNQIESVRVADESVATLKAPKFLSERARESVAEGGLERRISDVADALGTAELSSLKADVPMMYRNVEIKYSKFGVDDFDFGYYNKTAFSGLEIHISNSYANPMLQVMHYTPVLRNLALQHTATACTNESCLLCELGFLFDMLEKAEGSICQATNMLKALSHHPQAAPLALLEEEAHGSSLTKMLQGLNRFLCDRMVQDYKSIAPHSTDMETVLSTNATSTIRCMACRSEHTRPGQAFVNDLIYPQNNTSIRNARSHKPTFSQVLKSSIERETTSRGWCNRCQRYQNLASRKTIHDVPSVLMLNAAINDNAEAKQLWATPNWLPQEIGVIVDQGQFFCYQDQDLELHLQRGMHDITVYSLIGFAADIESGQHQKSHLVSLVNVAHFLPQASSEPQWHLFNDFLVRPVQTEDALQFNIKWKMPSVIAYQVKTANNKIDSSWKEQLDTSILYAENIKPGSQKAHTPLDAQVESPTIDTVVALDTEFVAIRQPEIEMNSDGQRSTIRPIVYALARVSVVRGSGVNEGTAFIDDYVASKEPIVDYLTSYSGIVEGDLSPTSSPHNLVSLKVAYKKLWVLLNLGCRFVGHGLKQDFRVANIQVPRAQVIDTIEFFFLKSRLRKLSLAFLAWYLLKEDIQMETHDSIEDARTALKLWRKYEEFQDAGILETILQDIYAKGREMNYRAPNGARKGRLDNAEAIADSAGDAGASSIGVLGSTAGSLPSTPAKNAIGVAPLLPGGGFGTQWNPGKGSPFR